MIRTYRLAKWWKRWRIPTAGETGWHGDPSVWLFGFHPGVVFADQRAPLTISGRGGCTRASYRGRAWPFFWRAKVEVC